VNAGRNLKRPQLRVYSKMRAGATSATASKEINGVAVKRQRARVPSLYSIMLGKVAYMTCTQYITVYSYMYMQMYI
jgi:hypothetical protein